MKLMSSIPFLKSSLKIFGSCLAVIFLAYASNYIYERVFKFNYVSGFVTHCGNKSIARSNVGSMTGGKWGLIDEDYNEIIEPIYDYASPNSFSSNCLLRVAKENVEKNEKFGFININGEVVIPLIYDHAKDFTEGLALVGTRIYPKHENVFMREEMMMGYINKANSFVIDKQFTYAEPFENKNARVSKTIGKFSANNDGSFYYINHDGDIVSNSIPRSEVELPNQAQFINNKTSKVVIINY